ncbi:MAG: lysophospholipid acyltransferase family protein [Pseudomonadota bacterium]
MLVPLFRLLSFLPLPFLHLLGGALGWLVYLLAPSYRRLLNENLGAAGYSGERARAIAEAGKSIVELPFIWCAAPARVARCASVDNWELVQGLLDAGRGIVFLTPHLGCFELTAQQIALRTALTVMYRPPRQAALKPLVEGARQRHNLHLAPATLVGVRILARTLKKGEPIGLLPDQVPSAGEGVWADFFGRSAYTMTLPAKLAQMGQAAIVLVYAERRSWGRGFVVRFVPFEDGQADTPAHAPGETAPGASAGAQAAAQAVDQAQQARAINAAMERLVARCPAQYFWSYNRYKAPPGVAAPRREPEQERTRA